MQKDEPGTLMPAGITLSEKILMGILTIGALVGVGFFLTHWDRPVTDATVFSAILVELPVQFYIQKIKK